MHGLCTCLSPLLVKHNNIYTMVKKIDQKCKDKKHLLGLIWSFSSELKFIFMAMLLLCTLATLLPFIHSSFSISTSDLRFCISRIVSATRVNNSAGDDHPPPPPPPATQTEQVLGNSVIKRTFTGSGWAAYNFVSMSAYRGGVNSFAVIGLSSKPLHVYGRPSYSCEWVPLDPARVRIRVDGYKILPDWGFGRVYTVVVVNCTFTSVSAVNPDNSGGTLLLHATTGDPDRNVTDTIPVMSEKPNAVDFELFNSTRRRRPKYDYLYCGSSLYGNLSPQRVREWMAYHARLFGERSHFVLHDAGGVHEEVMEVLRPWMELGRVTLHDIRDQERFDGYYHNQFMVVNDCLHRYRFMAKWMFFFDVDEFMSVRGENTLDSVMDSMERYSQIIIEQKPMSSELCFSGDGPEKTYRKWGLEKLVYRDVKRVRRLDKKYAIQPRNVFATGIHLTQNLVGQTNNRADGKIVYFHYHGSISQRHEPCRSLFNDTTLSFNGNPYVLDTTLRDVGPAVRAFELSAIGDRLTLTPQ